MRTECLPLSRIQIHRKWINESSEIDPLTLGQEPGWAMHECFFSHISDNVGNYEWRVCRIKEHWSEFWIHVVGKFPVLIIQLLFSKYIAGVNETNTSVCKHLHKLRSFGWTKNNMAISLYKAHESWVEPNTTQIIMKPNTYPHSKICRLKKSWNYVRQCISRSTKLLHIN